MRPTAWRWQLAALRRQNSAGFSSLSSAAASKSSQSQEDEAAAQTAAQHRLFQASAQSMSLQYCRDHGRNKVSRFLRTITIDMSYTFRHWRRHQRATRHLQLWTPKRIIESDNIRRLLFPDLAFIGSMSSFVCYYNHHALANTMQSSLGVALPSMLSLPVECFTLTSVALGLLATFKTQTGYQRFLEGRSLWGGLINESRAMASRIMERVPSHKGVLCPEVIDAKLYAVKLVRTFPLVLKYHLTEDGCNPHIEIREWTTDAELRAATTAALLSELQLTWNMHDPKQRELVHRLIASDVANRPLYVLHELQHVNASVFAHPSLGGLDGPAATEMDRSLTTFHNVLGACEKILRTPIYTPYTRFTSRFLFLWCNALPLAMYPLAGPAMTVPVTLVTSFFMLGIEDIGSRVEQPFNVLPLWQYCQTVEASCVQILKHSELLETEALLHHGDEDDEEFEVDPTNLGSYVDPLDIPVSSK
eukprot:TRINITY_DN49130_c0_g1_i1.p1 TRINITY_DN49130_c0_g1~~TRINITY_DN49130_c0_g1_i1.p1  ORF type:complete len:484 (-),score=68.45 TRINITY_DN49130_c0_g1_i1:46-1470(-)